LKDSICELIKKKKRNKFNNHIKMSDLTDDENYYQPDSNTFDNYTKFDEDSKKQIPLNEMPDKSMEFYSTTYMSKNKKDDEEEDDDEEDDEDDDVDDDDEDENEEDDDVDEETETTDEDEDTTINDDNYYDNSSIAGMTDSQSLSNDYQEVYSEPPKKLQMTRNDETKMIHMRGFLNKVEKNFVEKDSITQTVRKEIIECRQNIEVLEQKRDEIYNKLKNAQTLGNITNVNRLDAEHANICREIEMETNVLNKLNEKFNDADYIRSKALLEKTKYNYANIELKKTENNITKQKKAKAELRIIEEEDKVEVFKARIKQNKDLENERVKEESDKLKETIKNAKLAQQITNQYFKQALREMKTKRAEEETQYLIEMEAKRKNLLNLKQTVDHNKEMFQAKVNKKKFTEAKNKQTLIEQKNEILQRGENPNFFIPRKLKMEQVEKEKKRFKEDQDKNTQEIVKKILRENENIEKKKKLYPNLFNINLKPLTKRNVNYFFSIFVVFIFKFIFSYIFLKVGRR
jgi:hypothetical protein